MQGLARRALEIVAASGAPAPETPAQAGSLPALVSRVAEGPSVSGADLVVTRGTLRQMKQALALKRGMARGLFGCGQDVVVMRQLLVLHGTEGSLCCADLWE